MSFEAYSEWPGKIRGHARDSGRGAHAYLKQKSFQGLLLPKTLKVELERELKREKFLKSKEWISLTRHEKKKVRALFQQQRSLSTSFLEQVTKLTNPVAHLNVSHRQRGLRRGRAMLGQKEELRREVDKWAKVPLDFLSCLSLDRKKRRQERKKRRSVVKLKSHSVEKPRGFPSIYSQVSPVKEENTETVDNNGAQHEGQDTEEFQTLDAAFTLPVVSESKRKSRRGRRRGRRRRRRSQRTSSPEEKLNHSSSHFDSIALMNEPKYKAKRAARGAQPGRRHKDQPAAIISGANLANFQYNPPHHRNSRQRRPVDTGVHADIDMNADGNKSDGSQGSNNNVWDWPAGSGFKATFDVAAIKDDGFFGIKTLNISY